MTAAPPVSVFMAVRDEEADLADCVAGALDQDYDGDIEVVVAVGPSGDDTLAVARRLADQNPQVTVVENPAGHTPHGLNAAIAACTHDILVRADGHSILPRGYVRRVVSVMAETGAANVGGRMEPHGEGPVGEAVARTMSSTWGIGGAAFHVGGVAGPQPTVYLGSFRRDALESVGGYDETFLRAQDWELNHRLRSAGHTIWFDPELAVRYHPRSTWRSFVRQQFRTGGWRRRMVEAYPETASIRYLAPPVLVLAIVIGTFLGALSFVTTGWLALGFLAPAGYLLGVTVIGLIEGRGLGWSARWRVPLAMALLHLSWGTGFLVRAN